MKQGQWAAEWKKQQKAIENQIKGGEGGKETEKKCAASIKAAGNAAALLDTAFKSFSTVDQKDQGDIVKQFSQAQDDYNAAIDALHTAMEKGEKGSKKAAKKTSKKAAKKKTTKKVDKKAFDSKNSPINKSIGTALIGMDMIVKGRKREELKAANISKNLKKTCKTVTAFIGKATADKTGEYYQSNYKVVGNDMGDLLTDLDKFIRKNDKIDDKKAPPKNYIATAMEFADEGAMNCKEGDEEFDYSQMKSILQDMKKLVKLVEKWQVKEWKK